MSEDSNINGVKKGGSEGERRGNRHDISRLPLPITAGTGQLPVPENDSASVVQSQADTEEPDSVNRSKGSRDVRFHDESDSPSMSPVEGLVDVR